MNREDDLRKRLEQELARPGQEMEVGDEARAVPVRASHARLQDPFGMRLRANLLQAVIEARHVLADLRLPLSVRVAKARLAVRRARLLLKVCRDSLGPSYAARAARLKLCAGALKMLDAEPQRAPVGLVLTTDLPALEEDRRIAELDGLLRRCEVDAVSLAPGLIDAVGAAQALAKARRQSLSRARSALSTREPDLCRRWLKSLRRQAEMARVLAAEWRGDSTLSSLQINAQAEDLARYLKVDALYRRLCAQKANGAVPLASPEAVWLERKALWRRIRDRQRTVLDRGSGL